MLCAIVCIYLGDKSTATQREWDYHQSSRMCSVVCGVFGIFEETSAAVSVYVTVP